jgi:ATP-binding cassette subfamily B protein
MVSAELRKATTAKGLELPEARVLAPLWGWIRPYRKLVAAAIVLLLILSLLELTGPFFTRQAIDRYIAPRRLAGYQWLALLWVGVLLANAAARYAQLQISTLLGQHVMFDVRNAMFTHLQRLPVQFSDRTPVGGIVTRLTSDVDVLNQVLTGGLILGIGNVVSAVLIVGFLLVVDWRYALIVLGLALVMVFASGLITREFRRAQRWTRARLGSINGSLQEVLSGLLTVQLFNAEPRVTRDFAEVNHDYLRANLRSGFLFATFYPVMSVLGAVTSGVLLWVMGGAVIQRAVTLGTLVLFLQFAERLTTPIRDLADKLALFQTALAATERITELLAEPAEEAQPSATPGPTIRPGRIRFDQVWFAYREPDWVLQDVTFEIEPGERVAIVGATGAGKTSVISLLVRFYEIERGTISIDGQDIRTVDRRELRRRIGVVFQDPFLFTGSVADNIRLGEPISDSQVEAAASAVYADPFIRRLPAGYAHHLQERGGNLSTGQKQLLSFARAFAFEPEVLVVLDEATANVDPETERIIQASLLQLMAGRTSIIIAHRLSTIRQVDRIIVLHKGRVVEVGQHAELLLAGGMYARLYELQYQDQAGDPS